jgi:nucleotide sugar dehydrogenase|tara:strand:+ start:4211 stop:5014 length:804 start_codon:yes stop_codon:yes gene_type:complete
MKQQIIGLGVVGRATFDGFIRLGYNMVGSDASDDVVNNLIQENYPVSTNITDADIYWICTPEGVVEDVIKSLKNNFEEFGERSSMKGSRIVVIRSTVLPGTTDALSEKYGLRICHNPEFLREKMATWEFMNPDYILIGESDSEAGAILEDICKPFQVPIVRVDPKVSEMVKFAHNCHAATQISYWNEISEICRRTGVNSHQIGKIASLSRWIPSYGASMHGKSYGLHCLPKDLDHFLGFVESKHYNPSLLKVVKEVNDKMRVYGTSQ